MIFLTGVLVSHGNNINNFPNEYYIRSLEEMEANSILYGSKKIQPYKFT